MGLRTPVTEAAEPLALQLRRTGKGEAAEPLALQLRRTGKREAAEPLALQLRRTGEGEAAEPLALQLRRTGEGEAAQRRQGRSRLKATKRKPPEGGKKKGSLRSPFATEGSLLLRQRGVPSCRTF